jgi:hypothetical protein
MFNSFVVTDNNGNEVGNFKTEDEAESFVTNNGGKGYKSKFKKNGYIGLKGSYEEYFGSKQPGDVFKGKGGSLFTVSNGKQVPAKVTPLMPFSAMNNSLYKYYKLNGMEDKANEVLNLQIDHLRTLADVDGDIDSLPAGVTKDHPAYIGWKGKDSSGSGGDGGNIWTNILNNYKNVDDIAEAASGDGSGEAVATEKPGTPAENVA